MCLSCSIVLNRVIILFVDSFYETNQIDDFDLWTTSEMVVLVMFFDDNIGDGGASDVF